jgi:ubiquinone/menaquinone biosynthesis C-methylase UbiE
MNPGLKENNLKSFIDSRFKYLPIYYVLVTGIQFYALQQIDIDCKNKKILDLGCNDGTFFQMLFQNSLNGSYKVGLDMDPVVVREARKKEAFDGLTVADIRRMPYSDDAFDIIISNSTLEHVEDIDRAISEINRVLKPGGQIIFTVPSDKFIKVVFPFLNLFSLPRRKMILKSRYFGIINILSTFDWMEKINSETGFKINYFGTYMSNYSMRIASLLTLEIILWFASERIMGKPLRISKIYGIRDFIKTAIKNGLPGNGEFLLIAEKLTERP